MYLIYIYLTFCGVTIVNSIFLCEELVFYNTYYVKYANMKVVRVHSDMLYML